MKVIWSKFSRRVHRYDGSRVDERCNTDQILDEDRVVQDVPEEPTGWAKQAKLKFCRRCFPDLVPARVVGRAHRGVVTRRA